MSFFVIYALDRPGMLDQRQALRPAHRARLRAHDHPVTVHIGGPLLEGGEMNGTMLVIEAADRGAVEAYLARDPYIVADLFERCDIREFAWGLNPAEGRHG